MAGAERAARTLAAARTTAAGSRRRGTRRPGGDRARGRRSCWTGSPACGGRRSRSRDSGRPASRRSASGGRRHVRPPSAPRRSAARRPVPAANHRRARRNGRRSQRRNRRNRRDKRRVRRRNQRRSAAGSAAADQRRIKRWNGGGTAADPAGQAVVRRRKRWVRWRNQRTGPGRLPRPAPPARPDRPRPAARAAPPAAARRRWRGRAPGRPAVPVGRRRTGQLRLLGAHDARLGAVRRPLPHSSRAQYPQVRKISHCRLRPGDLLFFATDPRGPADDPPRDDVRRRRAHGRGAVDRPEGARRPRPAPRRDALGRPALSRLRSCGAPAEPRAVRPSGGGCRTPPAACGRPRSRPPPRRGRSSARPRRSCPARGPCTSRRSAGSPAGRTRRRPSRSRMCCSRGSFDGQAEHLVVAARLVPHAEHADRPAADQAARERRLLQQHERVQRVAVLTEGALDEAVVGGVAGGREQHAVQADATGLVVDLVLVALSLGDLDGDVEVQRLPAFRARPRSWSRRLPPCEGAGASRPAATRLIWPAQGERVSCRVRGHQAPRRRCGGCGRGGRRVRGRLRRRGRRCRAGPRLRARRTSRRASRAPSRRPPRRPPCCPRSARTRRSRPARRLDALLTPLLGQPALGGSVSLDVVDVLTGDHLTRLGHDAPRTPASTAKLLTAAAALTALDAGGDAAHPRRAGRLGGRRRPGRRRRRAAGRRQGRPGPS